MLRKVLKHDLNEVYRPWLIMAASALALAVIAGISLRALITYENYTAIGNHFPYWMPFAILAISLSVLAIVAYSVVSLIFVMVKYYQSFFTDVGYLTFTLPVKRSTLFNSKLLTGFIISLGTFTVTVLAIVIALLIAPANTDGTGIMLVTAWNGFVSTFTDLLGLPVGWFAGYFAVAVILLILYLLVFSNLIIYMCVTIGCTIVKKLKVLASIGIYYAVTCIMSTIGYCLNWLWGIITECIIVAANALTVDYYLTLFMLALIIVAMAIVVLSVIIYRFTLSRIEKNLNLA